MKIEAGGPAINAPRKQQIRQHATNVVSRGHTVTATANQWHRHETHAAIASLNEIQFH